MTQPITIAIIADTHYGTDGAVPSRRCSMADVLLARAVSRLNRLVRPDVTLVLGDLLDDGRACDAEDRLWHLRSILDKLEAPYIAIPGNHDGDVDTFYRVFTRPQDVEDICGVRFLPFIDEEQPGYNARRTARNVARLHASRADYDGPIVALQHVCLFPPGQSEAPYNYTNADKVITAMQAAGVHLSVSGHYHRGVPDVRDEDLTFVNAPGLCEEPFPLVVVQLDGTNVQTQRHDLAMPTALQLVDGHLHTQLAYCNHDINMTLPNTIDLANAFGLAGIAFAEHSGHLYFDTISYGNRTCFADGIPSAPTADNRIPEYLKMKRTYEQPSVRFGLEVDCDYNGNLLLAPQDRTHFDYIVGAIHGLPALGRAIPPGEADKDTFLFFVERLLKHDVDVLAHPFRVFRRSGWDAPPELFLPTARLLRAHDTPAEINFHTNEPPLEFIRICLELGVRFALGSDAHHLAEIGDFACHLALLKEAGFNGDLREIIIDRSA